MGVTKKKNRSWNKRIRVNPDRVSVQRQGPGSRLREHVKKRFSKPKIFMPLRMGRQFAPLRGPVADQMTVLRSGRSRKVGHPRIDPSNRLGDIGTVHGEFVTDKEV